MQHNKLFSGEASLRSRKQIIRRRPPAINVMYASLSQRLLFVIKRVLWHFGSKTYFASPANVRWTEFWLVTAAVP